MLEITKLKPSDWPGDPEVQEAIQEISATQDQCGLMDLSLLTSGEVTDRELLKDTADL